MSICKVISEREMETHHDSPSLLLEGMISGSCPIYAHLFKVVLIIGAEHSLACIMSTVTSNF
jgi:hypothetical protein